MYVPMSSLDSSRDIEDGHPGQSWLRLEDGQKLLSNKVRLFISNNSWVWYCDLSKVLYLGGCSKFIWNSSSSSSSSSCPFYFNLIIGVFVKRPCDGGGTHLARVEEVGRINVKSIAKIQRLHKLMESNFVEKFVNMNNRILELESMIEEVVEFQIHKTSRRKSGHWITATNFFILNLSALNHLYLKLDESNVGGFKGMEEITQRAITFMKKSKSESHYRRPYS